ncbi:hypothetical protein BASA81_017648 [Batrachochytrium salamandrivorans]|nr:hypothetical protein BASA81_017648 [Batrachochytrium salamandrivorans]
MQFGVAKCGIISFTGHLAHDLTAHWLSTPWTVVVMGKAYYGLNWLVATSHTLHHYRPPINKGYPTVHWLPDSRLPSDPLLVETGIGSLLTRLIGITRAVGTIPALVLVSSDQTAIQEPILADTTSQTKDSQATDTRLSLMETLRTCGDSASLQKYVTRQLLDTSGFFKDPSFVSIYEHMAQDI